MSDLVQKLRWWSSVECSERFPAGIPSGLIHLSKDAADLIEALEASLEDTKGEDGFSLMRRIEELEKMTRDQLASEGQWIEHTSKLQARIEALEAALREINKLNSYDRVQRLMRLFTANGETEETSMEGRVI